MKTLIRISVFIILIATLNYCGTENNNLIEKPNVLFIAVDDLNDWIEPLGGHPQAITPSLSRLAEEGVCFSQAYCAGTACNPSRTALLTGKAPYKTGMYVNRQVWRDVLGDVQTLPQYFTANGYWSAGAGKIFHNNQPDPQSWEDYYPSKEQHMPKYYHPGNGVQVNMPVYDELYKAFDWSPIPLSDEETADCGSVDWVIEQLNREHEKPFFLACGIYRPHLPWYVPQKYFDMFPLDSIQLPVIIENDRDDLPPGSLELNERQRRYHTAVARHGLWKDAIQGYLASITYADAMVGRLLDGLAASPYADNTIIVLWSDHGWTLGEKEHWRKYHIWENIANVVFMIKVPPGISSLPEGSSTGIICERTVSLMDIYPTLAELCNLPPKDSLDGRSIIPLLKNPEKEWDYPAIISSSRMDFGVSKGKWRYLWYHDNGGEELYNLENDPHEWFNLAGDPEYKKIIEEMATYLPDDPHPLVPRE